MMRLIATVPVIAIVVSAAICEGQNYPISQRASVSQNVAFTTISVTYGRPFARGRVLYPDLVPWDKVWHPGADSATVISFSKDVTIEGHALKAGEYSLWLIPRATGPWTVILSKAAHVYHQPYPGDTLDALRFDVEQQRGDHMEALAIYFPDVNREDAVMRVHWGDRIVPIKIRASARD
jgi:hypothetical protein